MASQDSGFNSDKQSLDPVLTQRTQGPSPQEEKEITISQERGVLDRLAKAEASGPTVRQRTQSEIIDLALLQHRLGNPFSTRYIPFEQLREMTTDLMLAFGWWMTITPLIRAEWFINCPDAQLSAAVDEALRPVIASEFLVYSNALWYGHQPAVKRFRLGQLQGTYRDPNGTDPNKDIPIWNSSVDALLWKPTHALNPAHCLPMWDDDGQMIGFKFSQTPIPHFDLISAASAYGYMVIPGHEINSDFAMWITNEQEMNFGCQPPDSPVLTTDGYIPIGELDPARHRLVSYKSHMDRIVGRPGRGSHGSYGFEKGERPYSGELLTVDFGDRHIRVTPNHKFTVSWSRASEKYWAVYLMRRGSWWRVGVTRIHQDGKAACSGVGMRLQGERATDAWVLGVFESKREALYHETLWSHLYGVPDLTFEVAEPSENRLDNEQLHAIWDSIDSESGARKLLRDRNLYEDYPLYHKDPGKQRCTQAGWHSRWTICAANLLPGLMHIPLDPGVGRDPEWRGFNLSREHYEGTVVSLEVLPYHHYISNGVVTQNSIFGSARSKRAYRYWWSYWFRWAMADRSYENLADPAKLIYYPVDFDQFTDPDDPNSENPLVRHARQTAIDTGQQIRSGATVAFPGSFAEGPDGHIGSIRKWSVEYLEGRNNFSELDATFKALDVAKLRSWFLPEQAFVEGTGSRTAGGSGGGTGGARMATQLGQVMEESQQLLLEQYDAQINDSKIPQFIAANFPEKVGIPCRKESRALGVLDDQTRSQVLQLIGQVRGEVLPVDTRELLTQMKVPLLNEAQMKAEIENIKELAAVMQPPETQPQKVGTQGYNAGVMKTSKGNFYYTAPERIVLAESDGFMNSLPDTPHYRDAGVRSAVVRLRRLFLDRYEQQYKSFVEFLEGHPTLQLAENQQQSGLDKKRAATSAAALIGVWAAAQAPGLPGHSSQAFLDETGAQMAALVQKIALSGGRDALKGARLQADDFGDEVVQPWVQDRVKFALDSIDQTVRTELNDWLQDELETTTDPDAVAASAREHFSGFAATHADRVARTETRDAFNRGALTALHLAGVSQVQAHDASDGKDLKTDAECLARQGRVISIQDAMGLDEHPNGTLWWEPLSTERLTVERVSDLPSHLAEEGRNVAYDERTETLYLTEQIDDAMETACLLMLGEQLRLV